MQFPIEQNEQNGDEVVANVKLHACVFEGLESALIRREFSGSGRLGARTLPEQGTYADQQTDDDKQQNGKIILQHFPYTPKKEELPPWLQIK
jgi:hypothetical protein